MQMRSAPVGGGDRRYRDPGEGDYGPRRTGHLRRADEARDQECRLMLSGDLEKPVLDADAIIAVNGRIGIVTSTVFTAHYLPHR
jgi:hypothetical protein